MGKASSNGIGCPQIIKFDNQTMSIHFSFIDGITVRDALRENRLPGRVDVLCDLIGRTVAKLHECDVVHGDITTSNLMLRNLDVNSNILDLVRFCHPVPKMLNQ